MTNIEPIGIIHSPYKEKFAVPRQPTLVDNLLSEIEMLTPYNTLDAFRGIEQYSHLWLIFGFNLVEDHSFRPLVRPPRLGGNDKMGIFACRSPFRPNNLGLSGVRFKEVVKEKNKILLRFWGGDLVEGTPIYDIKPYIAFSDRKEDAMSGFATIAPETMPVEFSEKSKSFFGQIDHCKYPYFEELIKDILSYDPRPAYRKNKEEDPHIYGVLLYDFNIRFTVGKNLITVIAIENITKS